MKEFKGTKGPWKVLNEDDFIVVHENDESVTFVAACIDDKNDANLIVAAPDLLDALQSLLVAVENIGGEHVTGLDILEAQAALSYAAIAKALGETK